MFLSRKRDTEKKVTESPETPLTFPRRHNAHILTYIIQFCATSLLCIVSGFKTLLLGQLGRLYLCTHNVQAGYAQLVLVVEEPHFPPCAIFHLPQDHQLNLHTNKLKCFQYNTWEGTVFLTHSDVKLHLIAYDLLRYSYGKYFYTELIYLCFL